MTPLKVFSNISSGLWLCINDLSWAFLPMHACCYRRSTFSILNGFYISQNHIYFKHYFLSIIFLLLIYSVRWPFPWYWFPNILSCLCPLNSKEENILGKKPFIIDDSSCIIDLTRRRGRGLPVGATRIQSDPHVCTVNTLCWFTI